MYLSAKLVIFSRRFLSEISKRRNIATTLFSMNMWTLYFCSRQRAGRGWDHHWWVSKKVLGHPETPQVQTSLVVETRSQWCSFDESLNFLWGLIDIYWILSIFAWTEVEKPKIQKTWSDEQYDADKLYGYEFGSVQSIAS